MIENINTYFYINAQNLQEFIVSSVRIRKDLLNDGMVLETEIINVLV
jgi:hypothetical protein